MTMKLITPLDYELILDEFSENKTLLHMALEQFNKDLAEQRVDLHAAVLAEDSTAIHKVAHKLKGAAMNLTADPLANVAEQFEILAKEGTWGDASPCMNNLDVEIQRFQEHLLKVTC